ncbi:MAG: hypothetical protein ACREUW_15740 [Burkholderiales bacterium]
MPRAQRRLVARALKDYFKSMQRDEAIVHSYRSGHTQTAIARTAGLSVSRISRLIAKAEAKGKTCLEHD